MQDDTALNGTIEVDEAYVGSRKPGKHGRGATGKTKVAGMVERGGKIQLAVVAKLDKKSLIKFIENHLGKNVKMVITDAYPTVQSIEKEFAVRTRP